MLPERASRSAFSETALWPPMAAQELPGARRSFTALFTLMKRLPSSRCYADKIRSRSSDESARMLSESLLVSCFQINGQRYDHVRCRSLCRLSPSRIPIQLESDSVSRDRQSDLERIWSKHINWSRQHLPRVSTLFVSHCGSHADEQRSSVECAIPEQKPECSAKTAVSSVMPAASPKKSTAATLSNN